MVVFPAPPLLVAMVMMVIRFPEPRNQAYGEHIKPISYLKVFPISYEPTKHGYIIFDARLSHTGIAPAPSCLVAERYWDQARWAIEAYAWRFDGLEHAPRTGGAA